MLSIQFNAILSVFTSLLGVPALQLKSNGTIVLIAGLEGTGHHFFDAVFSDLSKQQSLVVAGKVLVGNWNQYKMQAEGGPWSSNYVADNTEFLLSTMEANRGKVVEIEAVSSGSYPNGHGTHEERMYHRHPDLVLLSEAARGAGVNLRVIVTQRNAADILVATCSNRKDIESCQNQSITLATNAQYLVDQLGAIDPNIFKCVSYGDLPDLARGLAFAVGGPAGQVDVNAVIAEAWDSSSNHHEAIADSPDMQLAAVQMANPLHKLSMLCKTSPVELLAGKLGTIEDRVSEAIRHIMPANIIRARQSD